MENTQAQGGYVDSALSINKNYTQLFPKATIDIPIDSGKTLTLSYAKSISRPDYSTAVKQTTYINPYFEWASNININPSITNQISANIQYKDNSVEIGYYRTNEPVYPGFDYDPQLILVTRMDINYELESGVYLTLIAPIKYKCWNSTNILTAQSDQIKDSSAVLNKETLYLYFYSDNQFKLAKGYTFSISGWAITKRYEGIFERNG
jgi:hypothetical protein